MLLPPLDEILSEARVVSLPMATRFRGVVTREAMLLRGPAGWTEFSPFLEYEDTEAAAWLEAAIAFGWSETPAARREAIPVNATVPAVTAAEVPGVLSRFHGCRTAKVKVAESGQLLADDVARVAAVRHEMGPEGRIRVDANGAWNVDEAEHAVHALAPYDLEYVEQPCATVEELAEVRKRVAHMGILIAADESVRKAEDPLRVARAGAADLLVVKAQPLGGVRRALALVEQAGLPAVVSSALETSIGLAMGVALAAALPELDYDCGLGTASLFSADVSDEPLRPREGMLPVRRVTPSPQRLDSLDVAPQRSAWWTERARRCYAVLNAAADRRGGYDREAAPTTR